MNRRQWRYLLVTLVFLVACWFFDMGRDALIVGLIVSSTLAILEEQT
jgi:hypothetical protein